MTDKLYYIDAYIKEFRAEVLSSRRVSVGYETVLDKTAFFPEEGGQRADTGTVNGCRVLDVKERDGIIYHYTEEELPVGEEVVCLLEFDKRFEKMQCHTAEHILSGIIYSLYGFNNVGFHLAEDYVTFDVDAPMTYDMLMKVEELANRAVYENLPVRCRIYKSGESLPAHRAKTDIEGDVRIVTVGNIDSCACCAPHVSFTGEIGAIKMLSFESHKGGVRINMLAGEKAMRDYRHRVEVAARISDLTSTPQPYIADEVERILDTVKELKVHIARNEIRIADLLAERVVGGDGITVEVVEGLSRESLRRFANAVNSRLGGITVALCKDAFGYSYVICSEEKDLRPIIKEANAALGGKGGGSACMVQGSFAAEESEIRAYFAK